MRTHLAAVGTMRPPRDSQEGVEGHGRHPRPSGLPFVLDHAEDTLTVAAIRPLLFTGTQSSEMTGLRRD